MDYGYLLLLVLFGRRCRGSDPCDTVGVIRLGPGGSDPRSPRWLQHYAECRRSGSKRVRAH